MPDRPTMKDLAPAFARIAKIEAQQQALWDKREAEFHRIRKEGSRVTLKAVRKAKLVKGESVIRIGKWVHGIYEGTELNWPPSKPCKEWSFLIHVRTIRKNGRPGKGKNRHAVFVDHPGDVARDVRIVGRVVEGRVVSDGAS